MNLKQWLRRGFTFFVFFLIAHPIEAATSVAGILNVRAADDAQRTRVVFDLSAPVKYQVTTQSNPEKIVIDIQKAILAKAISPALFHSALIANMTNRAQNKNDWHFVLTLTSKVSAKAFLLPPTGKHGDRLVLDLYKTTPAVPIAEPKENASALPVEQTPNPVPPTHLARPSNSNEAYPTVHAITTAPIEGQATMVAKEKRDVIIVIDPGHGGKDPGAEGRTGHREKDVVLAISRQLRDMINHERGFKAILTRDGDYFIPLRQRLNIARSYKADLFIAIHADAFNNPYANGASVFALSERGATNEAARWLAEKENQSEMIGVGDLHDKDQLLRSVLIDLSQTHTISVSLQMGNSVLQQLRRVTSLHNMRVEQAAFVVLKSPDIPSLLIETGYISNPSQEQQLMNAYYQRQLAKSILQGIKNYFSAYPTRGALLS